MKLQDCQFIGVDIGGTSIEVGRFDRYGNLLANYQTETPQPPVPGVIAIAVSQAIESIDPNHLADFVGIGLPGPMDKEKRVSRICINLPGWVDVPLADWLEPRLKRRVILGNDGNCALLGEAWKGAAIGFKDVILLTLGTGVGGGVMLEGEIFEGHSGAASEPGLISINFDGPTCNSGNQGSLEQYGSSEALKRLAGCDAHDLAYRANKGDTFALDIWNTYGRNLGIGISSLIYLFTPRLVLLGGGISKAEKFFLPAICEEVEKRVQPISREGLIIRACKLGSSSGCTGAALLAINHFDDYSEHRNKDFRSNS